MASKWDEFPLERSSDDAFGDFPIAKPQLATEPAPAVPTAKPTDAFLDPVSLLSALSDEQNWYSAVPFETDRELSGIVANQKDYDETIKRIVNSMFYTEKYDVPTETTFRHSQLFAETLLGQKDITPAEAFDRIKEIRTKSQQQELAQLLMFQKAEEAGFAAPDIEAAPLSLFGNAFLQALAEKPAAVLRGVQVFTPGDALGFDRVLQRTSNYLESLADPEKKAEVERAAEGRLWPIYGGTSWLDIEPELLPETINAWAATVGDQIPIMLMTWAGRTVGIVVGAKVGAVVGAGVGLITGGPEPTDIVTVPAAATITAAVIGHLGGAAPLIGMEAGYFMDRANEIGIDKDIAEKYARWYGLGSGTIEYAQWIWNLKAFKRLSPKARTSVLKRVFGEIGGTLWEGFEELSQQGLENKLLGLAIEEQRERTPEFEAEIPGVFEGGKRAFIVGVGVSMIIRAPGHAYTASRKNKISKQIQAQTDATEQEATLAVETIAEGGPLADLTKDVVSVQVKAQAVQPVTPAAEVAEVPTEEVIPTPAEPVAEAVPTEPTVKPAEAVAEVAEEVRAEATEPTPPPVTKAEEPRGPRFAVAQDGRTVVDFRTQQEVGTFDTRVLAQQETNKLNAGQVEARVVRRAPLLPTEPGKPQTTRQLLNLVMRAQSKAARASFMEGARSVVATQTDLAQFASDQLQGLAITEAQRKQLVGAVAKTRTNAEKVAAIATIERLAEKSAHTQAVTDLRKTTAKINKQARVKGVTKGIRPEFMQRIKALTDTFVFQAPTERTRQRLASLKDHIDSLRATEEGKFGAEVAELLLPSKLVDRLDKINRKPVAEMTAEEVRDINNALQALVHLNQTKNRLLGERRARDAIETITTIMDELDDVIDRSTVAQDATLNDDFQNHSFARRVWSWIATTNNHDVETLVNTIEGAQEGALEENISQSLSDGRDRQDEYTTEAIDAVLQSLTNNNVSLADLQKISPGFQRAFKTPRKERFKNFVRALFGKTPTTPRFSAKLAGKTKRLTMDELMDIYMHSQAAFNLGALVKDGVTSQDAAIGKLSIKEIETIVAKVEANADAMVLVRAAQNHYENIAKPAINETSMQLIGQPLAEEPDYWHIERFKKRGLFGAEAYSISTLESQGRLQPRTGSRRPIVIRGFVGKLLNDISATGEYVGMAPAYRNIKMILNFDGFKDKVDSLGYRKERENLSAILQRTESPFYEKDSLDKVILGLLRGLTRTALAGPNIMFGQIVSANGYFDEMSMKYRTPSLFLKIPTTAEVNRFEKNWPFFKARRRGGASSIALQDIAQTDVAIRALGGKTDLANIVTSGIHAVDIKAIAIGGRLVEAEMADTQRDGKSSQYWTREGINPSKLKKGSPEYWEAFRKRARFVVRRTQPMFHGENRSLHTSVRKPSSRMWFLFRSYIDQPLRMAYRANTERANDRSTKKQMADRWANIMVTIMSYAVVGWLTDKLIFRSDKDWEDLIFDMITTPLKMLTVVGFPLKVLLERTVDVKREKRPSFFKPRFDNVATGFLNRVAESSSMIAEGLGFLGSGERFKSGPNAGELKSITLIKRGLFFQFENILAFYGIPAHLVRRSIKGFIKEQEGKADTTSPVSTIKP